MQGILKKSVKPEKPREEVQAKIHTLSDVQEGTISTNSQPSRALQRSQSLRVPKHSRSSLLSHFRESMNFGQSRYNAPGENLCGNTLNDNNGFPVRTTETKDAAYVDHMISQPRRLQRTFSIRENRTNRVQDRIPKTVTQKSAVFDPPAVSARSIFSTKKTTVQKALFPDYWDSDVRTTSRNAPEIDRRVSLAQLYIPRQINPSQNTKMEIPKNNVGVWKFCEENFFTSVPKVWTVSDCIAHVRSKLGRHGYGDLDLWIRNRCIMLDKRKSLSDYPGLTTLHVVRRPSARNPHPSYKTSRADDIDPFSSDDTCVEMFCGHATSPGNLYDYAWQKIQNGATEVTCPAIPNVNKPREQCSQVWEFKSISLLACLSDEENYLFCDKLFMNWLEKETDIQLCPVCNEAIRSNCANVFKCFNCERDGKSHSFCIKCKRPAYGKTCSNNECQESLPKTQALLMNCRLRTIIGVPNCPSVRACPVCQFVIEFDEEDNCKHMACQRNTCKAQFCFICLKVKTDKYYYPCGGAFMACVPSPRQII